MEARRRNRLVTIQQQSSTQDGAGQPVLTWSDLAQVYANIKGLSGLESIKAGAETSVLKVSIRVGYRKDLTAAMRVSIGETVYQVKVVRPDEEKKQFTDLECEVMQ